MEGTASMKSMRVVLNETAIALHGGEEGPWSWDNLPDIASGLCSENESLRTHIKQVETAYAALIEYIKVRPDTDNPLKDAAYIEMVESSKSIGLTPLTAEEFAREDKRILTDWNRRRHGIDDAVYPGVLPQRDFSRHGCIQYVRLSRWARLRRWWSAQWRQS